MNAAYEYLNSDDSSFDLVSFTPPVSAAADGGGGGGAIVPVPTHYGPYSNLYHGGNSQYAHKLDSPYEIKEKPGPIDDGGKSGGAADKLVVPEKPKEPKPVKLEQMPSAMMNVSIYLMIFHRVRMSAHLTHDCLMMAGGASQEGLPQKQAGGAPSRPRFSDGTPAVSARRVPPSHNPLSHGGLGWCLGWCVQADFSGIGIDSSTHGTISPAKLERLQPYAPAAHVMHEARVRQGAHLRQRYGEAPT